MSIENPINGYGGYNAIETDQGVLLFSRTNEGFKLFHDTMGLYMDNLYNPLCNNTYFNLHYIESDNPALREKCDIALKFPEEHLPLKFPVDAACFTDTSILNDSINVKINGWEPTPGQIQKITDYVDGVHIPICGDTFNISTLQEIAEGVSYNRVLLGGMMSDFKYEKQFLEKAKEMEKCNDVIEARKLNKEMKSLANSILKCDYPNIRKVTEIPLKKEIPNAYGKYDHMKKDGPDCYNAIETDKGVLLFSKTGEGKELFEKMLGSYLDNFYNPACNNTFLNLHYLECDSGALRGMSDLAIRYPKVQQEEFPPAESYFMDKSVLKYSLQEANFSWDANPHSLNNLVNDMWDGKHLPMKFSGDSYDISVLKEIVSMEFYYFTSLGSLANQSMLEVEAMPGFKYKDDFKELAAKAIDFSGHIREYDVLGAMKEKANEILKRDYPDIRKEQKHSTENKNNIQQTPPVQKKSRGL